jgi:carboxymethylenebutenolidase
MIMGMLNKTLFYISLFIVLISRANAMEQIEGAEGQVFNAVIAGPASSDTGIIIIHDWFGITGFTKESANRLAKQGARVIAVDLYKGESAKDHDNAKRLQQQLTHEYAQQAISAAIKALSTKKRHIAIVGYSAGGKFALRASAENPEAISAAALIYGGGYETLGDELLANAGPLLFVHGSKDKWSNSSYSKLDKELQAVEKSAEVYIYPNTGHAFAQKLFNSGKNYNPDATNAMHNVLDNFLARHLQ